MPNPVFKPVHVIMVVAFAALSLFAGASIAQSGTPGTPGEADFKAGNAQTPVTGTHESRKAERKATRKAMAAHNKKGAIPDYGEAGASDPNPNPTGMTRSQRHQDMKGKQRELAELEKSGKMPVTNEAGVNMPPTK